MTSGNFNDHSEPIGSEADLLAYFRDGEKPRGAWMVGTEHEKMGFCRSALRPIPYAGPNGIRDLLETYAARFGWEPILEGETLIGLSRGAKTVSLEPGGQLELSGAPLATTHETCRELHRHLNEIRQISDEMGITWLALGRNPLVASRRMPWMPKERYRIMRRYLPHRGTKALDMMAGTSTVQTNIDYGDEADMNRKLRLAQALGPVLTAIFANSPFAEGRLTGLLSARAQVWTQTDPHRCGIIPAAFSPDFGYANYREYALDVPMFFIHRDGHYIDYAGRSFREFLARGFEGHRATQADWMLHLSTLFPEVRLKNYIELRMVDVGPAPIICAFAALTRGLFYDPTALEEGLLLARPVTAAGYREFQTEAYTRALAGRALGRPLLEWARDLVAIARRGLERLDACNDQGENEVKYLAPVERILQSGRTQADVLLELYEGAWRHTLAPLFTSEPLL